MKKLILVLVSFLLILTSISSVRAEDEVDTSFEETVEETVQESTDETLQDSTDEALPETTVEISQTEFDETVEETATANEMNADNESADNSIKDERNREYIQDLCIDDKGEDTENVNPTISDISSTNSVSYNRDAALEYAANHWNTDSGQLCAEFVSNCIKAGGITAAWSKGCTTLIGQLRNAGLGVDYSVPVRNQTVYSSDCSIIERGDLIFFYCPHERDGKPYIHVVLFNGFDSSGRIKAYSHNGANSGQNTYYYSKYCPYCDDNGDYYPVETAYVFHFDTGDIPPRPALPNPWNYCTTPTGEYSKSSPVSNQVRWIQQALNVYRGAGLDVDGDFGTNTETAVKNFQSYWGLTADGIVGEQTIVALVRALNSRGYADDGTLDMTSDDLEADFYANIINHSMWKHLTVDSTNNVILKSEIDNVSGDPSQIYHFTRISTSPMIYKIISLKNGYALEVQDAQDVDGGNVQTYPWHDHDAQKWEFYEHEGVYFARPRISTDSLEVLDVTGGFSDDGTNIEIYKMYMVGNPSQRFSMWRWPGIATPSVTVNGSSVTVKWNATSDTSKYDVEFYKNGSVVKTVSGLTGTSTTQTLDPGSYQVRVVSWSSRNTISNNKGYNNNKAGFTVKNPLIN